MSQPVFAAPLTWSLSGVTFDDGGTAVGSFVFDADTTTFSAISIVTSPNPDLGLGTTYGIPTPGTGNASLFDTVTGVPIFGEHRLLFDLLAPMTNAGGIIGIRIGVGIVDGETICPVGVVCTTVILRTITAGSIVAQVPEPSTLILLATSVAGLLGSGYRRRKR